MTALEIAMAGYLAFGQPIGNYYEAITKHAGLQVIHSNGAVTLRLAEVGREELAADGAKTIVVRLKDEHYPFEVARYIKTWGDTRKRGEPRQFYHDGIWVGYRGFDKFGVEPRYPFGHGLSYTTWKEEVLECCQCENVANGQLELEIGNGNNSTMATLVTVRVTNVGKMAGRRAALLWAHKPNQPDAEMPKKELVAFDSVTLAPGESTTVRFRVGFEELKYWSEAANAWRMPDGDIAFSVAP